MKKKLLKSLSVALLLTAILPVSVYAEDVSENVAGNEFAAGQKAIVTDVEAQDIFCAGNAASVENSSASNIFIAGQSASIEKADVGADIFAAGQVVDIDDVSVEGNIFAAGNSISITDSSANAVVAAGNDIEISGTVGALEVAGETVKIYGVVNGDANIEAGKVVIDDDAVIYGTLDIKSSVEPEIPDTAQIGKYNYTEVKVDSEKVSEVATTASLVSRAVSKIISLIFWVPAMIIVGLLLCLFFGRQLDDAKNKLVSKPLSLIGFGALAWIGVPIASVALLITVIGVPTSGILMLMYITCIWLGLTFTGCVLGRLVLKNMNGILASIIGVAAVQLIRIIPFVGTLLAIAADMFILGYIISCIKIKRDEPAYAVATAVDSPIAEALDEKPNLE